MGESNAGNHKEIDDLGFDNANHNHHHENEEGNHLADMLQEPHFNMQWKQVWKKESESLIPISMPAAWSR